MDHKESQPLVSIIVPTYNRAAFITETIKSIQTQTYPNWEIIVVDDGSEDNTESVIQAMKDQRIQFHKAGRIGVGGKIKNIGLQKAKGSFIAFVDSDDLWAPTKLESQINALQQFPEAGFCLTNGYNFRIPGEPVDYFLKTNEGVECTDIFIRIFESRATLFTQALMFRKECLSVTRGFREVKSFSDADFIINLARHYKAVLIYKPLVFRRLHHTNYIHNQWEKSYLEGIYILEEYAGQRLLPPSVVRDAYFRLYINFGEKYLSLNHNWKAILQFFKAWRNKPFHPAPYKKTAKAILHYFRIPFPK